MSAVSRPGSDSYPVPDKINTWMCSENTQRAAPIVVLNIVLRIDASEVLRWETEEVSAPNVVQTLRECHCEPKDSAAGRFRA